MNSSAGDNDAEATSSTHFIPRRRPVESGGGGRRVASRPHSIGASIISNPKIVKGWQYYDNSENQRDIQKYFSTVQLGASTQETFLEHNSPQGTVSSRGGGGGTGSRSAGCGSSRGGDQRHSLNSSFLQGGGGDDEAATGLMTPGVGVEIPALVAPEEEQSCSSTLSKMWAPIFPIFLTIVSTTALALSTVLIESFPPNQYHPYTVLVWTSQGLFWPSFILLLCPCQMRSVTLTKPEKARSKSNNKVVTILLLILRALFGWTAAILSLWSLEHLAEDNFYMVIWISPVFIFLFAWLLLREKPGIVPLITAVVAIIGVGVICRPSIISGEVTFDKEFFLGFGLAAGAMLLEWTFSVVIIRHCRHVHFALVTFIYGLVGIGGGIFLYYGDNDKFQLPVCTKDTVLAVVTCVLVFIGQTGINAVLKYDQAGIFGVVRCWQVPMVVLWRFWFNGRVHDWINWIGAFIIILGIAILGARKVVESHPRSRRTRRWLGFLLN